MTDLLATSAATWRDRSTDPPAVPPELIPPVDATGEERIEALRRRHALRRERAEENYASSRRPERGWPVADDSTRASCDASSCGWVGVPARAR